MNEHQSMRTIWQVASLTQDGATSEQIEVGLGLSIQEVRDIREHLATPERAPGQPGTKTTPKEAAILHFIQHHMESNSSGQEAPSSDEIRDACGIETLAEMNQLAAQLLEKGYITPVEETPPAEVYDRYPEEETQGASGLLHPAQWQGPLSSLVTRLLSQDPSDNTQAQLRDTLLQLVLRKDTLRIMMDSELITRLHRATMDPGWQPPEYSPGWPHQGAVYIEISPPLTQEVSGIEGEMHGLIITQDTGRDLRGVLVPSTLNGRADLMAMTINPTTWEPEALNEQDIPLMRHLFLFLTAVAVFLTDDSTEIVPRPLNRTQRRRMARTEGTNPWHVIRPAANS